MAHTSSSNLRILIVDDHRETLECLYAVLKAAGFECRAALDARSALEIVEEFTPDVALLDLCLPEMDGFELASCLRTLRFKEELVVIALSGLDLFDGRERCKKANIDHLLLKPVAPDLLVNLIQNVCAIQRSVYN